MPWKKALPLAVLAVPFLFAGSRGADEGSFKYEDFDKVKKCSLCHKEIAREWEQSMMARSFVHEWDEAEYFRLALPHALSLEKVAGVKAGCIACHAPLAFLAGDIPPEKPAAGTRANEGVTCDICHTMTGSSEKEPFNFSYVLDPGRVKRGARKDAKSSMHKTESTPFVSSPELCACCHDEQSPYGAWVKSTYREWKAGPYGREGTRCQDCHMYAAPGRSTRKGKERAGIAHHNFHGSHVSGKLAGAVDVALYASKGSVAPGREIEITAALFNGKAGHFIPSGSTEERMLWLEVTVADGAGNTAVLPVNRKGFPGEEFTIADPKAVAYQAMGEIMGIEGFEGIKRDGGVPAGCRIFRKPFFDPEGRMTICQWYTAENERVDYRIGPRQTRMETYTYTVPEGAVGPLTFKAVLYYSQVPGSVGAFLRLPPSEYAPLTVNAAAISVGVE